MNLAASIKAASKLHGEFTLRSGKKSDRYFDKFRFESDPVLLNRISVGMAGLVPEEVDVLCGLEMGGIPIVTMLSHLTGLPAAFIRKEAKTYGTCLYAEGADLADRKLLIVEDVVSSGGAIIDAVTKIRNDGFPIDRAICVIDRETGGKEKLLENGIELSSLFTMSDIEGSTD